MLKYRKILSICVLAAVVGMLSACKTENSAEDGIPFSVQYAANCNWESEKIYPNIVTLRNQSECDEFCNENGIRSVSFESGYFDNNFAVAVEISTSDGTQSYDLKSVEYDDVSLKICISKRPVPPDVAGGTVMGEYFVIAGLSLEYSVEEGAIVLQMS